jgi:hypothetical protein
LQADGAERDGRHGWGGGGGLGECHRACEGNMTETNDALSIILEKRGYASAARFKSAVRPTRDDGFKFETLDEMGEPRDPVREFQRFYSLPETGEIDDTTRSVLVAPRCGVPDPVRPAALLDSQSKWEKKNLTVSLENAVPGISIILLRTLIERATAVWVEATNRRISISFTRSRGDLQISFGSNEHGDLWPFSGPNAELAHAFHPKFIPSKYAGQMHFDLSEDWSFDELCPPERKDFLSVAIHEIGHALGLEHVGSNQSVMYSNYNGVQRQLYHHDIGSISALYP